MVLLNVVLLNVVRSSRAAITSAARRQVHEGCADDCADCGPGDPHHDRAANTSAARRGVAIVKVLGNLRGLRPRRTAPPLRGLRPRRTAPR